MKAVVYPNLLNKGSFSNPYIDNFILALENVGIEVENKPHKNPLWSLWFLEQKSCYYFFHWIENASDFKYGYLQAFLACLYMGYLRMKKKKIIWFLHNKKTHSGQKTIINRLMMKFMAHCSDLVITHAREGVEYMETLKKGSSEKTRFLDHPSLNRLPEEVSASFSYSCDLLIWGTITPYKRIKEFLEFHRVHHLQLKVKIVGKCPSAELWETITSFKNEYIEIYGTGLTFEELGKEIIQSRFVLIPYASGSLLSSGTLMDSLSFGARVIGPEVGSFKDYAASDEVEVYTFTDFVDIPQIVTQHAERIGHTINYREFLNRISWPVFMQQLINEIECL